MGGVEARRLIAKDPRGNQGSVYDIHMLLASLAHSVLRVPTAPLSMRVALLGAT